MQSYPIQYNPFIFPQTCEQNLYLNLTSQNYQFLQNIETNCNTPIFQKNIENTSLNTVIEKVDPQKIYKAYPNRIDKQLFKIYSADILSNFFKKSTSKLPCVDFLQDHKISSH